MEIPAELLALLARTMLGRESLPDPEMLAETARRLQALLARVRATDETALQRVAPAFSFDAAAPAYATPRLTQPAWVDPALTEGGTGYGGAAGGPASGATTATGATATATGGTTAPPTPPGPGPGPEFLYWSATDLAREIRQRRISPVEVTRAVLDRAAAAQGVLNAFVTLTAEPALREAQAAEDAARRGQWAGPLHGVPVAVKDIIETAGVRTTAGSRVLADYTPCTDATCVARLRAAGAVIIGKTATHEFAFGATTDSPYQGPTRNPWHLQHSPAGSSGGSAAAVAAGLVPLALGTDTGGSVRMPAAACGIPGLKPTYGRISKAGVIPLSWSLDHVGPLARTVADLALALAVLAGPDPLDPTALPLCTPADWLAAGPPAAGLTGLRLGVPAAWLSERVDAQVLAAFHTATAVLRDLGAEVVEVNLPPAPVLTLVNRLITLAEAAAWHAPFLTRQAGDYGADVRVRLELGQFILARDYLTGQRLRAELSQEVATVMAQVDAVLTPTLPIPAPRIGQAVWDYGNGQEPVPEALIRFTAPFSVTGQPAASVPCGHTAAGLPVGLQIIGRPLQEGTVLRIAAAYEQAAGGWLPTGTLRTFFL